MSGAELIAAERERQVSEEGWTPGHDDGQSDGELADAAICYAMREMAGRTFWPWDESWWKPADPVRDLVKAGALIAAEIDRLQRAEALVGLPEGSERV